MDQHTSAAIAQFMQLPDNEEEEPTMGKGPFKCFRRNCGQTYTGTGAAGKLRRHVEGHRQTSNPRGRAGGIQTTGSAPDPAYIRQVQNMR